MKIGQIGRRWTLGGLMVLIALVALPLAWYVHRVREFERAQAVADFLRAKLVAHMDKELEKLVADRAKDDEILRQADEAIARAKAPPKPSAKSIPAQVKDIVKLLDERAKFEEEFSKRQEAIAAQILARREKQRLEKAATQGTTPPARALENPR
jgi:hypothetical protein